MPSTNQKAGDNTEYESEQARMLQTKPKGVILSFRCMSEADARRWVVACNRLGVKGEVVEHFADELRRLQD